MSEGFTQHLAAANCALRKVDLDTQPSIFNSAVSAEGLSRWWVDAQASNDVRREIVCVAVRPFSHAESRLYPHASQQSFARS